MTTDPLRALCRRCRLVPVSLKWRTTLAGFAALLLAISLSTVLMVQRAERDTLAERQEDERREVAHAARLLGDRVVEMQTALRLVAEQLDEATLHDGAALARFMHDRSVLRTYFGNVAAATPDGQLRVYLDRIGVRQLRLNVADRPYFRQTMTEGRPVVSEAMLSRAASEHVVVLTYPLRSSRGIFGMVGGVLWLDSGDLASRIIESEEPEEQGALVVVSDAQGRLLSHPDPNRLLQPIDDDLRLRDAWAAWQQMRSPQEPSGLSFDVQGAIASAAAVPGTSWLVWRVLPRDVVLAPIHAARRHALRWAAVVAVVASVVLLGLMSWQLRPLRVLTQRARHLFDGAQEPHAGWPDDRGEIGELARVLRHVGAERAQLEAANSQVLMKLELVMAAAPVGIAFTRGERFELVNVELCRLLGRTQQDLVRCGLADVCVDGVAGAALLRQVRRAFHDGHAYHGEYRLRRGDGSAFWAALAVQAVDLEQPQAGLIWTVSDIDAQVAARTHLQWSAHHDPLTALANRAAFEQRVTQVFQARPKSIPAALVAIDLDHFKPINDTAGHAAGDAMLKAVASAIRNCVRAGDLVARLGGDEFIVLLERCPPESALRLAAQVCDAIARAELPWEGKVLRVGASAGVAALEHGMGEVTHWLRAADRACYDAKAAGRGQARIAPTGAMPVGASARR